MIDRPSPGDLDAALAAAVDTVTAPCIRLHPGSVSEDPTSSYVDGHPYLPDGTEWPTLADRPAVFVAQVNFSQVPSTPVLPTQGLLQWFVADDDTYGSVFDETEGSVGFIVRWYPDPVPTSTLPPPTAAAPYTARGDTFVPVDVAPGTEMRFTASRVVPNWEHLPTADRERLSPLMVRLAHSVGEDPAQRDLAEFVWDEYIRGGSYAPLREALGPVGAGSKLGGHPSFTQFDPRGTASFPSSDAAGGQLLLELDSNEFGGWGDAGIGHLFGAAGAVACGDLTTVRYHWDCY